MLMDGIFCEVICDSKWIHVRREKLQLLLNSVGIDRVVAITDMNAAGVPDDGMDVSLVNDGPVTIITDSRYREI